MELKEYVLIIKNHLKLFVSVWVAVIIIAFLWYFTLPLRYEVSIPVEISRKGQQQTEDFRYDQYYRVEADSKFADTVVQWFSDPSTVNSIYAAASKSHEAQTVKDLSKKFKAEKLAPQYIRVSFQTANEDDGKVLAKAIREVANQKNEKLNENSKSEDWFSLIAGDVIIAPKKISFAPVLLVSLVGGFIVSMVAVMLKHYWE